MAFGRGGPSTVHRPNPGCRPHGHTTHTTAHWRLQASTRSCFPSLLPPPLCCKGLQAFLEVVSTHMMTTVASPCPQAAHTWRHIRRKYAHTHTVSLPCRVGLLTGPGTGQPPGGQGAASVTSLCQPPRRHPDISSELEQREGDLKKEPEKNKRKRKKREGREGDKRKGEREC